MKEIAIICIVLGIALLLWLVIGFFLVRYIRRDKSIQSTVGGVPVRWGKANPRSGSGSAEEKDLESAPGTSNLSPAMGPGTENHLADEDIEIRPTHSPRTSSAYARNDHPPVTRHTSGGTSHSIPPLTATIPTPTAVALDSASSPARRHQQAALPPPTTLPPRYEDAIVRI